MHKFVGKSNEFIPGVPARDIPDDEWALLPNERRELAEQSGLYKAVKEKAAAKAEE